MLYGMASVPKNHIASDEACFLYSKPELSNSCQITEEHLFGKYIVGNNLQKQYIFC